MDSETKSDALPAGWVRTSLDKLGEIHCGQSPSVAEVNTDGKGIPYVTGPDQWNGHQIERNKWTEHPRRIAPEGSIFITVKGAGIGTLFPGIHAAIGRDIYAFRPSEGVNPDYVFYALRHTIDEVVLNGKGDIPGLSKSHILDHSIGLPGATEQGRIVTKIEELFSELDNAVGNLRRARAQLRVYRQALLKHAFDGGPATASGNTTNSRWQATDLGEVLEHVTSGSRGWAAYYAEEGDIFIRAQNLKHDRLDFDDVAYVQLPNGKKTEGTRTRVEVGDVLVTITGANVTKTGLVEHAMGVAYVNQHVALLRPTKALHPRFLYWYLISEAGGRGQLKEAAYGAGKPGLNLGNIKSVSIPLPSVEEQTELVQWLEAKVSLADRLQEEIGSALERVTGLRQAIMKEAFAGRLVPQDPSEEPASALLDRIKAGCAEDRRNSRKRKTGT